MVAVSTHALAGVMLVAIAIAIGIANREWSVREALRTSAFSIVGTIAAGSVALVSVRAHSRSARDDGAAPRPDDALRGFAFTSYMRQRQESERVQFLYESMRKTQAAPDRRSPRTNFCSPPAPPAGGVRRASAPRRRGPSRSDSSADGTATSCSARRRSTTSSGVRSAVPRDASGRPASASPAPHVLDPLPPHARARRCDRDRASRRATGARPARVGDRASDVATFETEDVEPARDVRRPRDGRPREQPARAVAGRGDGAERAAAPPGAARSPHGPPEPPEFRPGRGTGARIPEHAASRPLPRPRRLQGGQRHPRPRSRGRAARPGRGEAGERPAARRHPESARRRRVCRRPRPHQPEGARRTAERILEALERPYRSPTRRSCPVPVSASRSPPRASTPRS